MSVIMHMVVSIYIFDIAAQHFDTALSGSILTVSSCYLKVFSLSKVDMIKLCQENISAAFCDF